MAVIIGAKTSERSLRSHVMLLCTVSTSYHLASLHFRHVVSHSNKKKCISNFKNVASPTRVCVYHTNVTVKPNVISQKPASPSLQRLHHLLQFVCYVHSRSMPIQSNCTKGRIAIAAVIRQKVASQLDFLSCSLNLSKVFWQNALSPLQLLLDQRLHCRHDCNLTKVHIILTTVI